MTIELITQKEYDFLVEAQQEYPNLTFNNEGYQYLDKSKWTANDKLVFEEIEKILRKSIIGFKEFNNFKLRKGGDVAVRFQYDWTADDRSQGIPFTGAGYLSLKELLNGFKTQQYETVS